MQDYFRSPLMLDEPARKAKMLITPLVNEDAMRLLWGAKLETETFSQVTCPKCGDVFSGIHFCQCAKA